MISAGWALPWRGCSIIQTACGPRPWSISVSTHACRLDGGQWVYPTWQFTDSGSVPQHLITLWTTLRAAADPWTCAIWLRSPQSELGDRSAVDWITDGHPVGTALELARADAQRWAA